MRQLNYVIVWKQPDWGLYYRRNEAFAWHLASRDDTKKVLHLEIFTVKTVLFLLSNLLFGRGVKTQLLDQLRKTFRKEPLCVTDKLYVYAIFVLTKNSLKNRPDYLTKQLAKVNLKDDGKTGGRTVLIAYPPSHTAEFALEAIAYDILVTDIVDDAALRARNNDLDKMVSSYEKTLPKSDWIITTGFSNKRYENIALKNIEVFANGVSEFRCKVCQVNRPRGQADPFLVGYVGSINSAIDWELLEFLLKKRNDIKVIFHGFYDKHGKKHLRRLKNYDNFAYGGKLHYKDVPLFLCSCDILINPKKDDFMTAGNDSLKIYQYLMTGKPIVSTSMNPAPKFRDYISVADTPVEFCTKVEGIMDGVIQHVCSDNIELASNNSWDKKIDYFVNKIHGL